MIVKIENNQLVINHPTGIESKYADGDLIVLKEIAEKDRDAANFEMAEIDRYMTGIINGYL